MTAPAGPRPIVLVIDDDASLRHALVTLFRSVGLQAETFASAQEFLQCALPEAPSCLVLDVRLPGISGLDFQTNLSAAGIRIPIIFITGHGDVSMSVRAMKAGAVEFLTKPFRDQDLLDAVQRALEQDRIRREEQKSLAGLRGRFASLTPREQEVITLVTAGLMNKQIAGKIGVSEITVKVHRSNAVRKLGVRSLAELIKMTQILGLDGAK